VLKTFARANTPAYCATPPIERKKLTLTHWNMHFWQKKEKKKEKKEKRKI
jgi:hypothetical protein